MTYHITLEDLCLECIIGILPLEREKQQKVIVNAEFVVNEILDYRALRECIQEGFKQEFYYLEDAHQYFQNTIPKSFPQVNEFWIKIAKPEIFTDCNVAISTHYKE